MEKFSTCDPVGLNPFIRGGCEHLNDKEEVIMVSYYVGSNYGDEIIAVWYVKEKH